MQKTNVIPLQEVVADDIQRLNDYVGFAIQLVNAHLLAISSGTIFGLGTTQNGASGFTVASGAIFTSGGIFGELENGGSGFTVTLPTSGSRVDAVAASYLEVIDTPVTGWIISDPATETESVVTLNKRKFGSAQISVFTNTAASAIPAGYLPLAEVTSTNAGISTIVDKRAYSIITGLNANTLQQSVSNSTLISAATIQPCADVATLEALTDMQNEWKYDVKSMGIYRYDSTATDIADGRLIVQPNSGVGRFFCEAPGADVIINDLMVS